MLYILLYYIVFASLVIATCSTFMLVIIQLWSDIIDIILSMNRSEHRFLIMMEYFINQGKYYYLVISHINITICVSTATVIAIGRILIFSSYLRDV